MPVRRLLLSAAFAFAMLGNMLVAAELPPEFQNGKEDKPVALSIPMKTVWKHDTLNVQVGQTPSSITVRAPLGQIQEGEGSVLRFRVRMGPARGGWNNLLHITVNGAVLDTSMSGGMRRALNYDNDTIKTLHHRWPTAPLSALFNGETAFLVFFTDSWDWPLEWQIDAKRECNYYALDVTDLIKPNQENTITFKLLGTTPTYKENGVLVVDDLQIGVLTKPDYDQLLEARDPARRISRFRAVAKVENEGSVIEADAGGAVRITKGSKSYYLCSEYSYPGKTIRYNRLMCGRSDAKVRVAASADGGISVDLTCPYYSISRVIKPEGDILRVADKYHNTGRNVVGIITTNELICDQEGDVFYRDRSGNVILDRRYSNFYSELGTNLRLVPVVGNHWHNEYLRMQTFLLDECKMDGIYVDCFNSVMNDRMYDRWDGNSVEIDPHTGVVQGKFASLGIISSQARANWAKHCIDQNKVFVVNGYADTAELQSLPIISFCEAEWSFDPDSDSPLNTIEAADGQVSCPLGLGVSRIRQLRKTSKKTPAQMVQICIISYLRHGLLYCHYFPIVLNDGAYGMLRELYPFTPKELGEGFVIGEEKIAGCVSRTFDWPGPGEPKCKRFNLDGIEIPGGFETTRQEDGTWKIKVAIKDWKETYLISQMPVDTE